MLSGFTNLSVPCTVNLQASFRNETYYRLSMPALQGEGTHSFAKTSFNADLVTRDACNSCKACKKQLQFINHHKFQLVNLQPIMSQYSPTTEEELMIQEALQAETHETLPGCCILQFRCCPSRSCSRP